MLRARDAVTKLKAYHPPLAGRQGLRLDFNESTAGCSPRVLERLRSLDAETLARYPDRAPVEADVAAFLGREASEVLLTNGVDEAIHLMCSAYLDHDDEALIVVPTFAMYGIFASAEAAKVTDVQAGADFAFPLEALLQRISDRTRLIAMANPNNPTGGIVERDAIVRIATAAPNAAVLVDEAYFEFYGKTVLDLVGSVPNLFVARTFSKAYGLAGLRCGILAGCSDQMHVLRAAASPYNVNAVALAVLLEALKDRDYVDQYAGVVRKNRALLEKELATIGLMYWPSQGNFVLVRIGDAHAAFVQKLRERGILVRDRNSDPGCKGCVRLTVGTDEHTQILIHALRAVVEELEFRREVTA